MSCAGQDPPAPGADDADAGCSGGESFALRRVGSHATCTLGDTHIAHCDADLSPRRLWWRREDAD